MFDKMKQLYDMQKKATDLKKQLESMRVEKSSKDGLIRASVTGALRVESLSLDPSLLSPDRQETLQKAVTAVINEALADVQKQAAAQAAELMKGLPNIPGL